MCKKGVVGLIMAMAGMAHAQFVSLHQFPVTYTISSALDANGNIYFTKTPELFGFKDQFAPFGVSGCVMGYAEYRSLCQRVNGGFDFSLEGYTSYTQYRVYIPAGTTFFGLSGFLPQGTEYAATVKIGAEPSRTTPLTQAEYEAAKRDQKIDLDFGRLLAGEERIMVHDGGGNISLSGTARLSSNPLPTGQWLYVRVLNGSYIDSLRASYEVDQGKYLAWYNNAVQNVFGSNGDPVESGTPPPQPDTTATGTVVEQPDAQGNMKLVLQVHHTDKEVAAAEKVSYWVGASVPVNPLFFSGMKEVMFLLADAGGLLGPLYEWRLLFQGQPVESVAFERDRILVSNDQTVQIPLNLTKQDMRNLGAKVYFGYQLKNGTFKTLNVIWNPS